MQEQHLKWWDDGAWATTLGAEMIFGAGANKYVGIIAPGDKREKNSTMIQFQNPVDQTSRPTGHSKNHAMLGGKKNWTCWIGIFPAKIWG